MGRGERIVGRPWTDVPRLPVMRKGDPWARQAPLPGGYGATVASRLCMRVPVREKATVTLRRAAVGRPPEES